ncbi:uncharacterized protein FOMMEDRAFT_145052 [Fomitiporia mediterranea MF3/22]|uniref:uncharacterized protein n=1 Tax=Fomitiporia mediterranea (strain MF3/22) TaxID=694068 RepID=UPI0004409C2C|nr:uncharacterized protein FOMMEDRAFT_145052 [Fomitiporia mediterranea MF3/22]EJD05548.1 hypothetical protein FOMMEDRAFT_145052 [Fomitiporia mediterranea MF3/22]
MQGSSSPKTLVKYFPTVSLVTDVEDFEYVHELLVNRARVTFVSLTTCPLYVGMKRWLSSSSTKTMPPKSTFKRFVEVGRVVLIKSGPSEGQTAVIIEIVDHNRAIIDGPLTGVSRQAFRYRHLALTPFVVPKLPRGAGSGVVRKRLEAEKTLEKWSASPWAKNLVAKSQRGSLNDFQRFQIMVLKKQRRYGANVKLAKAKASA